MLSLTCQQISPPEYIPHINLVFQPVLNGNQTLIYFYAADTTTETVSGDQGTLALLVLPARAETLLGRRATVGPLRAGVLGKGQRTQLCSEGKCKTNMPCLCFPSAVMAPFSKKPSQCSGAVPLT